MTDAEELAVLCRKPWNLSLDQYSQLDDWQIVNVYFRPSTAEAAKNGGYWPMPSGSGERDLRELRFVYFREGRRNGIPEKVIKRAWRDYKMVLLYGTEGPKVPHVAAMRHALQARGDTPEQVEQAIGSRRKELAGWREWKERLWAERRAKAEQRRRDKDRLRHGVKGPDGTPANHTEGG